MSITFGSVGDVIAVGQIAWALARALTDSRGSAKEYQDLVKELQAFDQALLQVVALWQNYENSPELEALGTTTKEAIKDWKDTLLAFRLKIDKKYGTNLCAGGSGNWLKDASKKVKWLTEKEDILELRRKLHSASDTLTMSILAAMGKSNRLTSSAQAVRVELVHGLLQDSIKQAEEQMAQLKLMDKKLDSQATTSSMILTTVKSGVNYLTQVHAIAIDMRNFLALIHNNIVSLQATPKGLGTHWQQEPVTLEDALGFVVPIPLELVNSWDMFDTILTKRFEKHPGHSKMLRREFAIEEGNSGREVSRKSDFILCLHPGQKINMSMIFKEKAANSNHCPRCGTKSAALPEIKTQCASCKGWFQRVTEVNQVPVQDSGAIHSDRLERSSRLPRISGPVPSPADFQRVRMLRMIAFGLSLKDTDENPHQDKWAQIRKNDAERHARRQKEGQRKEGDSQEMSEETMEVRVARIKARVAELTGNMDISNSTNSTSSSDSSGVVSRRGVVKTERSQSRSARHKRHLVEGAAAGSVGVESFTRAPIRNLRGLQGFEDSESDDELESAARPSFSSKTSPPPTQTTAKGAC